MATVQDPTVQRRRLRAELRKVRDATGLKQAEVARAMDWSPSKLIRIESGQVNISTNDLKALLAFYGVKDMALVNSLLELARQAKGGSFYDQYGDLLKPGYKEYLAYEASASVIRQYDPVMIPGLLQTEEYARSFFQHAAGYAPDTADRLWGVRQHRQELHDREKPPEMVFVLDEAALRRMVGRGHVMRHQLERLKEFAAQPHVSIQVLPFARGAHPGMMGNFILLEFADPHLDDLVHLESINSTTVRDDAHLIAHYLDRFLQLEEQALTRDESIAMLEELIRSMEDSDATPSAITAAKVAS
jgi:transcriptional regulator with XRE-family HTH domain